MTQREAPPRLLWLDVWRGCAVLVMLCWHFCWDLGLLGLIPLQVMVSPPAVAARYFIICSFTLISGICARFTRSGLRRGGITLACAAAVTLVTWLVGDPAWFGVLHLLGCCMVLYALFGKTLERIPEKAAFLLYLLLFLLTHQMMLHVRVQVPGLFMFGLRTNEFYSSDYYPLFPWGFLFLMGTVLGGAIRRRETAKKGENAPRPLGYLGRHALWIYLIHQPVLIAVLTLFTGETIW